MNSNKRSRKLKDLKHKIKKKNKKKTLLKLNQ